MRIQLLAIFFLFNSSVSASAYLWQTNSAGDDIHIYSLDDFQLVSRLTVGANPHGLAMPRNESIVYVSLERYKHPHGEILSINPDTLAIERRIEVCREPQNIEVTPDGKWLYIPCYDGYYAVMDALSGQIVQHIVTDGRPHNAKSSPDGRYMYLAPLRDVNGVTVVDVEDNHKVVGFIPFGGQVRPLSVSANGRRLYQQVTGVNGFRVADTDRRIVVKTVEHQTELGSWQLVKQLVNRAYRKLGKKIPFKLTICHGIAVRPGLDEIWSTCGQTLSIHEFDDRAVSSELAQIKLDGTGYWVSFSSDGHYAAIALYDRDQTVIVDANRKEVLKVLDAGNSPKRNLFLDHTVKIESVD